MIDQANLMADEDISGPPSAAVVERDRPTRLSDVVEALSSPAAIIGLGLVLMVLVLAIGAPLFSLHDPQAIDIKNKAAPPIFLPGGTWDHPLGTDGLGRDLWARIVYGLRTSLVISVLTVTLAVTVGM